VLGYLHHHREVGLRYSAAPSEPWGHSDSNWATRRSASTELQPRRVSPFSVGVSCVRVIC